MIQERYEGESYQEGNLGGSGKHMVSEFIQKVESMCFLTDWVWDERKRKVKDDFQVFGLSNHKERDAT